jgi:hypothetical protein
MGRVMGSRGYSGSRLLIIEPICGLANRLRALISAQRLAERWGRELALIWANNYAGQAAQGNCRFEDLFASHLRQFASFDAFAGTPTVRLVSRPRYIPWDAAVDGANEQHPMKPIDGEAYAEVPVLGITAFQLLFAPADHYDDVMRALVPYFLQLQPVAAVADAVSDFCSRHFAGPVLGMHIRRGDHGAMLARLGTEQPAEEDFWAYADACLSSSADLRVFCATDDAGVKERLLRRFRGRAFGYPSASLARTTAAGMQAALIDLLLLSHATFVCGSPGSTFTELAALRNLATRGSYDTCVVELPAGIRGDGAALSRAMDRAMATC